MRQAQLLAVLTCIGLSPAAAAAQSACRMHGDMLQILDRTYGEAVTWQGLSEDGKYILELLTSSSGSWTLIAVRTDGTACTIGAGSISEDIAVAEGVEG